jgi:predicted Zn-dependent protease
MGPCSIVVLKTCLFFIAVQLLCRTGFAQVPESGRWQDLDFGEAEMNSVSGARYHDMLRDLAGKRRLDDDWAQLRRIHRISGGLVRAAIAVKPAVASWRWEAHSTSDPAYEALCMPGGKLLIGTHFIRKLALTDGELATLLGHEIAHALADHYRETLTAVRRLNSDHPDRSLDTLMEQLETDLRLQLRLSTLNRIQEAEADQLGMSLAHHAGWRASSMVSFYRKLASVDPPSFIDWTHPSASSRLSMATALAILYEH